MAPRHPRVLLAPGGSDDEIVVSRRKVAELLRRPERLDRAEQQLREAQQEIRRLREVKARSQRKSSAWKGALDRLRSSLPVLGADAKTAATVGVPSSKVFFREPPPPADQRRPTRGQPGHPGTTRPRPTPNAPTPVLELTECPRCEPPLGAPADWWCRPITDLPTAGLDIFDLVVPRYKCSGCGARVHASIPEAYRGEFGPRLQAFIAELRVLGVPFEKIAELLRTRYYLEVSVATLIAMEAGVAESLDLTYQELEAKLQEAERTPHAEGDETGIPVGGRTEWLWVGASPTATVYPIQADRGGKEAAAMWVGYRGTLTHDGLDAYNSVAEAQHQFDLVHRDLVRRILELRRQTPAWGALRIHAPLARRACG